MRRINALLTSRLYTFAIAPILCVLCATGAWIYVSSKTRDGVVTDPKQLQIRATPLELQNERIHVEVNQDRLALAMARLADHDYKRWSQLTHGLRLWGANTQLSSKWDRDRMLSVICSAEQSQLAFGFAPHILNRNGIQFSHRLTDGQLHGEKHRDETISILAEAGVPSSTEIKVWQSTVSVADIVRAAALNCDLNEEIHFSVLAFAHYLSPQRAWLNKFGDEISFDLLCDRLCDSPLGSGGCGGCHTFFSLAVVLNADKVNPLLSDRMRKRVRDKLASAIQILKATQRSEGTWDANWFDPTAQPDDDAPSTVIITGHSLEWLAVAPQDLIDNHEMAERACEAALNLILSAPSKALAEEFNYYSHAGNALKLWSASQWAAELNKATHSTQ